MKIAPEAQGKIGQGLTFHGLRHTVGRRLAEAGADDFTIMATRYRRDASRKLGAEAAVRLLENN